MGMFDSIFVEQTVIEEIIKGNGLALECFDGYYSFQTKDLDKCLTDFYIERDGHFKWIKHEYEPVESYNADSKPWIKNGLVPTNKSEKINDTRTAYFNFYDFFVTDEERVFVTFTAHVKNGKLAEPIVLKEVEHTNLKEEYEAGKKSREQWLKTQATWEWQLAIFIFEMRWRIKKAFLPLFNFIDKVENNLRDKARAKHLC